MKEDDMLITLTDDKKRFFDFARERYRIMLRKRAAGKYDGVQTLTDDPILRKYHFCNVFREDDKMTVWLHENFRRHFRGPDAIWQAFACRWFNHKIGLAVMAPWIIGNLRNEWDRGAIIADLEVANAKGSIFTSAYLINSEPGISRIQAIVDYIEEVRDQSRDAFRVIRDKPRLEVAYREFIKFRRVGGFLAYQVALDLRQTPVLDDAIDVDTWAAPGPGSMRGLSRIVCGYPNRWSSYTSARNMEQIRGGFRELLEFSRQERHWPVWEMQEVEHTLCEFDKYERIRATGGDIRGMRRHHAAAMARS